MRVLIGCECSGVVRRAFTARGHDAWSCDFQPADDNGQHIQGDVLKALELGWDIAITHPPCDFLTVSGNTWFDESARTKFKVKETTLIGEPRRKAMLDAFALVLAIWNSNVNKICIENPVGRLSSLWRKPNQTVQPWEFGHGECKRTCFWLKNLPRLVPTHIEGGDLFLKPAPKEREQRLHRLPSSPMRKKLRSVTFSGIAEAMAEQWG